MIDKQTNTRLKNFAQAARRYLIDQVNTKLSEVLAHDSDAATYGKTKPLYKALLAEVKKVTGSESLPSDIDKLMPLAERVAYTWFNRLTALRYMDLKHFNPVGIISPQAGDSLPQILLDAKTGILDAALIDHEDRQRALGLLSGTVESTYHKGDAQSEAYRILLLGACNNIGKSLPFLFKPIKDWMELLLPDDLLGEHGILAMITDVMTEESCQDVEVIGWLYQYYISEKKDEVFAQVKGGKKVQSHEIPAVTQLFTPHWIVKYMVQNSLGRLWLEGHPKSAIKNKMEYYIGEANSDASQTEANKSIKISSPEEIKFCDPCCGSGHILTYAFDLLYDIYSEEGYDPIDIPRLIISKNLYGIEIDERASELAAFALSMKAREKDRQWFARGLDPQICHLQNIRFAEDEIKPYMEKLGYDLFSYNFERMLTQFEHADTFGSLIVPDEQDIAGISELLNSKDFSGDVFLAPTHNKVLKVIEQADYLGTKYQVVVTNPPYLGTSGLGKEKDIWFRQYYPDSRTDFFAMFMERCLSLSIKKGFIAMINMQSWMFLSSYEKLREKLIRNFTFITMAHLGPRAFDSISGEVVSTASFVLQNSKHDDYEGAFFRLIDGKSEEEKRTAFFLAKNNPESGCFYRTKTYDFSKAPGNPIAYWVSDKIRDIFVNSIPLSDMANARQGLATADNDRFLRQWFEVSIQRIGFGYEDRDQARASRYKWFPYNKGGSFRKWYGNQDYVVNWENDGEEIKNIFDNRGKLRSRPQNMGFYFKQCISWSALAGGKISLRYSPQGFLFDTKGQCIFSDCIHTLLDALAFLNSCVADVILDFLAPTLDFNCGVIGKMPFLVSSPNINDVNTMIYITKEDWDSYETSWDFKRVPILEQNEKTFSTKEAYELLRNKWIEDTTNMQKLEEENNSIIINVYGLNEIKNTVSLREVSLTCNPYYRYGVEALPDADDAFPLNSELEKRLLADTMKELISYAVGCMFGRYSLDKPGLILANQGETLDDYLSQVRQPSFMPDKDNVIPILEGEWFVDDIVSRFSEFLKVAYGVEKYSENISFIEEAIGKDLRAYFLKDFYNDHVRRYKKRPIYWLFSSPKGSFTALIYMHRYTPDTVSIMLNGYLRENIHKMRAKSQLLDHQLSYGALSEREKMRISKEVGRLKDVISELEVWDAKVILPLAERRLEIDLDDGVKVNYAKFGEALKDIK